MEAKTDNGVVEKRKFEQSAPVFAIF